MKTPEIFISYAWGGDSETIVNELDKVFQQKGITIIRDKRDLGFKGEITDFMKKIGAGNAVIIVISDKYLKSPYCMFELLETYRNLEFKDRIFPIVLQDANIFEPIPRLQYLKFWQDKKNELDNAIKDFGTDAITVIGDDYKIYKKIFDNFGEIVNILKDINSLTPQMHRDENFKSLYDAVEKKIRIEQTPDASNHTVNLINTNGSGNVILPNVSGANITVNVNQSQPISQPNPIGNVNINYKIPNIVKLLTNAFDDVALQNFGMMYFDTVYNSWGTGQNKTQRIMSLVDYCKRNLKLGELLEYIKEENPAQYQVFQPYF